MAQQFIDALMINIKQYKSTLLDDETREKMLERLEEDTEIIRAGAILHDIMHIPYAHTLEDENRVLPKGDKSKRIDKMVGKIKGELDEIEIKPTQQKISSFVNYRTFSFPTLNDFKDALFKAKKYLEDVKKILWTIALHDDIQSMIEAEKNLGTSNDKVFEKVKKKIEREKKVKISETDRYYISDIIGNTISADLISYILRDPEFTGIETKPGGWYRLFDYLEIARDDVGRNRLVIKLSKKGEWRQDAFSTIIRILNTRYDLTEQVTYHHAKLSASAMLGKIAYLCGLSDWNEFEEGESEWNNLYEIGDEGFFKLLETRIEKIKKRTNTNRTQRQAEGAKKLLESLKSRRLHKRFHVVSQKRGPEGFNLADKYSNPTERWALEEDIEKKYNLTPGSIILFCPSEEVALKEAEILIAVEKIGTDGKLERIIKPLNSKDFIEFLEKEIGKTTAMKIRNVEEQYEDLWKLYVFIEPSVIPLYGAEIKKILNEKLGCCRNFDLSYLELMDEYILSKEISQKVTEIGIPQINRQSAFQKLPEAIEAVSGRDKMLNFDRIRSNLNEIIGMVKSWVSEPQEKQRRLPL